MVRRQRKDGPGKFHHVMNRGLARRPMFETRADIRQFLAGVARAVRRREIEVHAWCVLTTHFHLLVRSPRGRLSQAMRRIQNAYVRYFNRRRGRDGSLVRGRFDSRPVESMTYRRVLVGYIDANPVRAGLCDDARRYPWCSASQYAGRDGPPWLCRTWVEQLVAGASPSGTFEPRYYPPAPAGPEAERTARLVASRWRSPVVEDDLDDLVGAASSKALAWLRRKARLADGVMPGLPYLDIRTVMEQVTEIAGEWGAFRLPSTTGQRSICGWNIVRAGLLRGLAGARHVEIADALDLSSRQVAKLCRRHRQLLTDDQAYGASVARITQRLIQRTYSGTVPRQEAELEVEPEVEPQPQPQRHPRRQ